MTTRVLGRALVLLLLCGVFGGRAHGIESTWRLRRELGLARETAVVGAVGASFTLGKGIDPLALAR